MKSFAAVSFALLASLSLYAQDDDVYYSPRHDGAEAAASSQQQNTADRSYDYTDDETYSDYDGYYEDTETVTDASGNTYITNNYYGDYYESDYEYTTRLRRYYSPYMGFGYYSPCYSGYYYDPFYYTPGWSVSVSFGWGWGYPSYWGGYYDPWYRPYYSYNPWGWGAYPGWGYGGGYWAGYNHGYQHGYWDGYYDGYYGYPGYGGYSGNYHYGPRYRTSGVSSYRNSYAEKQSAEVAEKRSDSSFPMGENRDVMQPVKIDNNTLQPVNTGTTRENAKPLNSTGKNNVTTIDKGRIGSANETPVPQNQSNNINKGEVKPVDSNVSGQTPSRATNGNELKSLDPQRNTAAPTRKPDAAAPNNEIKKTPTDGKQLGTAPKYNENRNVEKQAPTRTKSDYPAPNRQQPNVSPRSETSPERGNINGKTIPKAPTTRNNNINRNDTPKHYSRDAAPRQQFDRGEQQPQRNTTPTREMTPRSNERGGTLQAPQQPRGGHEINRAPSPAPSNRGTMGAGRSTPSAPQGGRSPR